MTECFERLAIKRSSHMITDREYFNDAMAHFRGERHDGCSSASLANDNLRAIDPVGSSIREMAVNTQYRPMDYDDTDWYEELFEYACRGKLDKVQAHLQVLKEKSLPAPLQPLATLAADRGLPHILRFCLDQGAVFDPDLEMAALYTPKTPGMIDLLTAQNWRNIAVSESARMETGCAPGSKCPPRPPMPSLSTNYTTCLTTEQIRALSDSIPW